MATVFNSVYGIFVVSKETKSESDESCLISPSEVVNNKTSDIDINVLPQQQLNQGEEVKKDHEHQNQDMINQSQEKLDQELCNHNQTSEQTQHDSYCENQENLNQKPEQQQNLINQTQDEAKQLTSESQHTQWPSGQSFPQGEQQTKEQGHGESSSTTTSVTTPTEPQTPNKTKAICNAPVPIGWPKVINPISDKML